MNSLAELAAHIDPIAVDRNGIVRGTVSRLRREFAQNPKRDSLTVALGGKSIVVQRNFRTGDVAQKLYALMAE